jgi:tRNA (guanine9-N1)-methyltransferase
MDDGTEIAEQSVPNLSQTDLTTPAESAQEPQKALSKSALKKAAKAERFAANKLERRAREKEAKKERKRSQAAKRAAGELDDGNVEESNRRKKKARVQFGSRVVVDLGFDDMMSEKVGLCYPPFRPCLHLSTSKHVTDANDINPI